MILEINHLDASYRDGVLSVHWSANFPSIARLILADGTQMQLSGIAEPYHHHSVTAPLDTKTPVVVYIVPMDGENRSIIAPSYPARLVVVS